MLEVKFETPNPLTFRERDDWFLVEEVLLEARAAGRVEVSSYDKCRYAEDGSVAQAVRESAPALLQRCLDRWPEGRSVMSEAHRALLPELFDGELSALGITAKTELLSFSLTQESAAVYREALFAGYARMPDALKEYIEQLHNDGPCMPIKSPFEQSMMGACLLRSPGNSPSVENRDRNLPEDRFCRLCGTPRPESARFCPECGAPFS